MRGDADRPAVKGPRTELGRAKAELGRLLERWESAPESLCPTHPSSSSASCPSPDAGGLSGWGVLQALIPRSPGRPPSTTSGSATAPPGRQRQSCSHWPSGTLPWWPLSPTPNHYPIADGGQVPHAPPSQQHAQNTELGLDNMLISLDPGLEVGEGARSALHGGAPVRGRQGRGLGAAAQLLPEPTGPGSPALSGPGRQVQAFLCSGGRYSRPRCLNMSSSEATRSSIFYSKSAGVMAWERSPRPRPPRASSGRVWGGLAVGQPKASPRFLPQASPQRHTCSGSKSPWLFRHSPLSFRLKRRSSRSKCWGE